MRVRWHKLGRVYAPAATGHPKLISHAANPLPMLLDGDVYRVFFSGRDDRNRSSVGAVDIDIARRAVVRAHGAPVFGHGAEGTFYADGVSIGNSYVVEDVRYMLFMGWQRPVNDHWRGDVGRLIVTPDLDLLLERDTPFLGSDPADPISLSYPWVMAAPTGGYAMWYGSTIAWDAGNGEMLHVIKQATSRDGHEWIRGGLAVPYELGRVQALSRPTVIGSAETGYRMWFSYRGGRGTSYRIGHATSDDGRTWALALDSSGLDPSADGWDSEMVEYPFVFEHKGQQFMLYNGNRYGATGFGLAVLT